MSIGYVADSAQSRRVARLIDSIQHVMRQQVVAVVLEDACGHVEIVVHPDKAVSTLRQMEQIEWRATRLQYEEFAPIE